MAPDAARRGARLVVSPEAFVGGYPKGHDFGVSLGMRTPEGRDEFRRLFENAVEVPGPATEAIGAAARDHAVHLVVGVIERAGGTLYCTALIFGPDGALLGKHRKVMPTALERVVWGSGTAAPPAERLAGRTSGEEAAPPAALAGADLARAKFDFDVVGHSARPDVFRLHVNERPMPAVVFDAGEDR